MVDGPLVGRLTPEQLAASRAAAGAGGGAAGGGSGGWHHSGSAGWAGSDGECMYFQGSGGETYASAGCD